MALTFRGGVCPEEKKAASSRALEEMHAPALVKIPLRQHRGAPAISLVKEGDEVLKGQKIGAAATGVSCPVHSSVSGRVSAVREGEWICIENDFRDALSPQVEPFGIPVHKAAPIEIITHLREKGVVEQDGEVLFLRLEAALGKAEKIVILCLESEPYLSASTRLFLDKTEELVGGAKILLRALSGKKAIFALPGRESEGEEKLRKILGASPSFAVAPMKEKYPQDSPACLVRALFQKEIPRGKTALDLGVAIFSAAAVRAVYHAVVSGMPEISRVLTVGGDCVKEAKNLIVPVGVSFREALDLCGGLVKKPDRILSGGPMAGVEAEMDSVVEKTTTGILALQSEEKKAPSPCLHCGRCVHACPMRLEPLSLYRAIRKQNDRKAIFYKLENCNECGVCTYICPAKIPLLRTIREGKRRLAASRKTQD